MEGQSADSIYTSCLESVEFSDCNSFRKPQLPRPKGSKPKSPRPSTIKHEEQDELLIDLDASFSFPSALTTTTSTTMFRDIDLLSGRPSLLFDDCSGRESLGILPQFKLPTGSKSLSYFELESADSFLVSTERQLDPFVNIGRPSLLYDGRESLGILPQFKSDFTQKDETLAELECFLVSSKSQTQSVLDGNEGAESLMQKFQRDCEAIESGDFQPDVRDSTDENYSVYVEANFLASKIADNSILDISQEGGTILDKTPQPDFVDEEDSLNKSETETESRIDTESVYRQVDLMLPACSDQCVAPSNTLKNPSDILEHLTSLLSQQDNNQVRHILHHAMKEIAHLYDAPDAHEQSASVADEEDSGHSSTENEKELRDCNAVLDLSLKANHTSEEQALDLSFAKEGVPRRLSITFSHHGDPALPAKQQSNALKQQTLHMRQLWGSGNTEGGSVASNDSKASSTGSMKVKLKPKKSESDLLKRGPLKAVVPLAALNTSVTTDRGLAHAPGKLKPMAQSTPEERSGERRKSAAMGSPLARPQRTTPIGQRVKKMSLLNRPTSYQAGAGGTVCKTTQMPAMANSCRTLSRGKSSVDLKPLKSAEVLKKPPLRRSYSVGGKENVSVQQSRRESTTQTRSDHSSINKLPLKNFGMKPFNTTEKLCKN